MPNSMAERCVPEGYREGKQMNTDRLNEYLRSLESRLRLAAITQGAAALAVVALVATVLVVLLANHFAFSGSSVTGARVLLFLAIAATLALALLIPLRRINRRNAARTAEQKFPQYQERLLTFAERFSPEKPDPFLELLAADAWNTTSQAPPNELISNPRLLGLGAAALLALITLGWLAISGPGFLGHGVNLVWGNLFRPASEQPFYNILVQPGDSTVRRGSDQLISAQLVGFQSPSVRLFRPLRQRVQVGRGRDAARAEWQRVPVHDRGNSGKRRVLRRSRRHPVQPA